jgi:hypothetical protein
MLKYCVGVSFEMHKLKVAKAHNNVDSLKTMLFV